MEGGGGGGGRDGTGEMGGREVGGRRQGEVWNVYGQRNNIKVHGKMTWRWLCWN